MDFFAAQDQARRNTRRLLVLFGFAVAALIALSNLAIAFGLWMFDERLFGTWNYVVEAPALDGALAPRGLSAYLSVPLMLGISLVVVAGVALAGLWKSVQLASGGSAVAELLDGELLAPDTQVPARRRLLNTVEEMAIAAGMPVPPVYVLPESGINAFAAGHSVDDAVIGITEGAVLQLDRDELQGVLAHEFSHILNGDMRLNMRLIALLHGVLFIAHAGRILMRSGSRRSVVSVRGRSDSSLPVLLVGVALLLIGYAGVFFGRLIKAGVSRQREFLADASAVQFTRQPRGLACALARIGGLGQHGLLQAARAEEASHLLFAQGVATPVHAWFDTHPPLEDRIRRIDPAWDGNFPAPRVAPDQSEPIAATTVPFAATAAAAIMAAQAPAAVAGVSVADPLREACRDTRLAPAVVLCCLMHERLDARSAQLELLGARNASLLARVNELAALGASRNGDALVLLELCMPALKQSAPAARMEFWELLLDLVELDGHIDLREMLISVFLQRHLVASPLELKEVRARYSRLEQVQGAASLLFSGLALAGQPEPRAAARAVSRAGAAAQLEGLQLLDAAVIDWSAFYAAMWRLRGVYPLLKPRLIKGCRAALAEDGIPLSDAASLMGLVAAVLDCPLGTSDAEAGWPR